MRAERPPRRSSRRTRRSGSGQGSGFNNTPYVTLNSVVVAPMPRAMASTAIAA
jgi:hypothetical protein